MKQDEIVAVVDENNRVVGALPRSQMRAEGQRHRATYILVFDSGGRIFVQKRTAQKDIYPGFFDVATGGVVLAGESYEASALRELAEELGIKDVPLSRHFDFCHEEGGNRVWGRVFSCVYEGDVVLQAEEVESGEFLPLERVLDLSRTHPFTPDGLYALKGYLEQRHRKNPPRL